MSSRSNRGPLVIELADLDGPVEVPVEAYISLEYVQLERDRLWKKVWLQAGRVEDMPDPGDYLTYDILDDSILISRGEDGVIRAFHNVCPHRGRQLVDKAPGARNARGSKLRFTCKFHGWTFNTEGQAKRVLDQQDWRGALEHNGCLGLTPVKVDTWGGWIWINMDPDSESLAEYLSPIPGYLDPFQLENQRPKWRMWTIFECNWKTALEAFMETYHIGATHPEFNNFGFGSGNFRSRGVAHGTHSNLCYDIPEDMDGNQGARLRLGTGGDPRKKTFEMVDFVLENAGTNFTETLRKAAANLVDEVPEGTPPAEVLKHWLSSAKKIDAERGVIWPEVPAEHVAKSGTAWQVFPNFLLGFSVNNALCYQARPYGNDPDKCYFEAAQYELWPAGEAPETEWTYADAKDWPYVLRQDFDNMAAVQRGMKSSGFTGPKPNPHTENSIANFHRNLARYMGAGIPHKLLTE